MRNIISCDINIDDTTTLIKLVNNTSLSGSIYNLTIQLFTTDVISASTQIKVNCDCLNFMYQCKSLLHKHDAVYGPVEVTKLPKKINKPFVCKHLYAALILLKQINNVININVKGV